VNHRDHPFEQRHLQSQAVRVGDDRPEVGVDLGPPLAHGHVAPHPAVRLFIGAAHRDQAFERRIHGRPVCRPDGLRLEPVEAQRCSAERRGHTQDFARQVNRHRAMLIDRVAH
jgi:hypothetical protein